MFIYQSMSVLLHLGELAIPNWFGAFNFSWTYQVSDVFPPLALAHLDLSTFISEHVTGQFRLLILVAHCWMEAPWLSIVLSMLEDTSYQCTVVKDLVRDV